MLPQCPGVNGKETVTGKATVGAPVTSDQGNQQLWQKEAETCYLVALGRGRRLSQAY